MVCDDSHLPAVQAGNLGTMFLELRRVSRISKGAVRARDTLDMAITSHVNLIVRTPTIRKFGARIYQRVTNWRTGLPALKSRQLS